MQSKIQKLKNEKFFKISDVIIIAVVVFAILILLYFTNFASVENPQYNIYVENELYQTGSLSEDAEIIITTENGTAIFHVENGAIHMHEATCPDGLCIEQGEISSTSSKIICLPLKIVCEITGGAESEIDAVS
ncbi:MAG: NusG domain II-containing protein [Bacillota bacterium]